jgi:ribosomal protein S18 acetylase RimI-like enzyme
MTVSVRLAGPGDFSAISRLTVAAYRADGQLSSEHDYEAVLADVAARAGAGKLLVAVDGAGAVRGAVLFVLPTSPYAELARPGEAEFRMLAVDPTAQGRGIGRVLVLACLQRAVVAGCSAVVISVRDNAIAARRLYEGLGFRRAPDLDWTPLPGVHLLAVRRELPVAGRSAEQRSA